MRTPFIRRFSFAFLGTAAAIAATSRMFINCTFGSSSIEKPEVSTPPPSWGQLVDEYYRLRELDEEERASGAIREAYASNDQQIWGPAEDAHFEAFTLPRWRAATAVYAAPASTIEEILDKLSVIEAEDAVSTEEATQGLTADLRRLLPSANPTRHFALAWLARWTGNGGSVTIDPTNPDKAWIGLPEFDYSRGWERETHDRLRAVRHGLDWFQARSQDERESLDRDHYREHADRYHGRMRELYDMLYAVDGAVEAVKAIVRERPQLGLRPPADLLEKEA